ncbi:hypothetical protein J2Y41_004407 [Arthrobacter sp. 1088]|nr:hypothetical protein [Arthrobacter sp. 1088]
MTTASASILPENALAGTGSRSWASPALLPEALLEAFVDAAGLVLVAGLLPLPVVLVAGLLPLPGVLGARVFLAAVAGVEDSAGAREAPNSASMTSPSAWPALFGLPAVAGRAGPLAVPAPFSLPALFGLPELFGLPALFGLPRASALGTFGRRVAMTLL